mgnify:FL=1
MIRTTREVTEMKCINCGIIHLLGETFNGRRCCEKSEGVPIGTRTIVEYAKTDAEERSERLYREDMYL